MAGNPLLKVYFDWDMNGNYTGTYDDASDRAVDAPGSEVMRREFGANFEGRAATPGTCTVRLWNKDNRLTAGYASSPIVGKLVPGVPMKVQAVYSSTTYPIFEGRVTDFVPNPEMGASVCDVLAVDDLSKYEKRKVSLPLADTRSISEFRAALLLQIGLTSGQYSLSPSGPEMARPPTAADQEGLLDVMADLNEATRSIDFLRPTLTGPVYVVKDRTSMLGGAIAATYTADQAWVNQWRVSEADKVNYQLVEAAPYQSVTAEEELWRTPRAVWVGAGVSRVKIAKWSDPLILGRGRRPAERTRYVAVMTGTVTVSVTFYSTTARIAYSGGASGGEVKSLTIYGYPAEQQGFGYEESDRSAGDLAGRYDGQDVSSRFLAADTDAKGLADYLTFVGTQPPLTRPTIQFAQDLFPDILVREPGDRIVVSDARLGIVAQPVLLESVSLSMLAGGHWRASAGARSIPALSFFTVGGSAAQGVGGSAILGY